MIAEAPPDVQAEVVMEEQQHHQPSETTTEAPLDVQAEVVVEAKAAQDKQEEATSREAVSIDHVKTEEETDQDERVIAEEPREDAEKGKAVVDVEVEEKVMPEESVDAVKECTPVPEEKPQTGAVEEASEKEAEDKLPPAAIVEESAKEPAAALNVQDESAMNTVEEEVVVETNAAERQQEELPKPEEITENSEKTGMPEEITVNSEKSVMPEEITVNSEKSVTPKEITENSEKSVMPEEIREKSGKSVTIAEESKEQPAAAEKQQDEVADEEPKMIAASRASSLPATSLEAALEEMDATTKAQASTSRSEPVSPAKEAISKDKVVIDTLLSASAPTTPVKGDVQKGGATSSPLMAKIPEEMRLSFKGRKVKTAMEKRTEEEQPKKKEVARSNDVLEETKSKLLEKKKSKVGALVGAFETVMDSPRVSTPGAKSRPAPR
jgi:hypothetical protein